MGQGSHVPQHASVFPFNALLSCQCAMIETEMSRPWPQGQNSGLCLCNVAFNWPRHWPSCFDLDANIFVPVFISRVWSRSMSVLWGTGSSVFTWTPPPADRGPSLESIYWVSLTVDLCEGNKILSFKKFISPQPVGGLQKEKNPGALGTCPVCPLVKTGLHQFCIYVLPMAVALSSCLDSAVPYLLPVLYRWRLITFSRNGPYKTEIMWCDKLWRSLSNIR